MRTTWPNRLSVIAGILAAVTPAAAYYHYVHYLNSSSPYTVAFERYDLTALPDQTVTFFVSNTGPASFTANDSFPSLLEQLRNATMVWNSIASSSLRVGFGGLQTAGTQQSVPTGQVLFSDQIPPGVLAYTVLTVPTNTVATAADGTQFIPIQSSQIFLNSDMVPQPGAQSSEGYTGPSYSESFFMTLVHEIGHAVGLQHTYTSASMSTAVSRATNRARPLDADDIAGVSLLYPAGGFPAGFGSISGQVTMSGQPVHLASVVAILPNGSAISSLTRPDGTYEIDGLPPGTYYVYVHPLPCEGISNGVCEDANITLPLESDGQTPEAPGGFFVSTFYPGTWNPADFTPINITQGLSQPGINFSVQPRQAVEVYDVTSYWYPPYQYPAAQAGYLQPAFLNANDANVVPQVIAQGNGLTDAGTSTNVESVTALGGLPGTWLPDYGTNAYVDSGDNLTVDLLAVFFDYTSAPSTGPEHLIFSLPDDIFVLPQAIQVVGNPPPSITSVTPNADGSVTIAGTGLSSSSQVYFDSLPAQVDVQYAANPNDSTGLSGSVSVWPPPGASNQTATINVYNPDGQNSTFLQSQTPGTFTYSYPQTNTPSASISLSQLPQGASAMVAVKSNNMQFVDGITTLGFGSGDITVRHLWVLNPNAAVANITVAQTAVQQETVASVISGFQVYQQGQGFQVTAGSASLPLIDLPVQNAFYPLQNSLYPGAIAAVTGQNLQASSGSPTMTIGGQPAEILYTSPTEVTFVVPLGINTGPAIMQYSAATYPLVLQIDPPPPVIVNAVDASGALLGGSQGASPGDTVTMEVSGLGQTVPSSSSVSIAENGVSIPFSSIQQAQDGTGNMLIQFTLDASITGQVSLTVTLNGDLSMPFYISVAPALSTASSPAARPSRQP